MHNTKKSDNEQHIYHYTTHEAAFSILNEQKLRLNNLHHLNDGGEFLWTLEHINQYVLNRKERNEPILDSVTVELNNLVEKKSNMHASICVACFSTRRDDAAQWDRYAKGGRGVCLKFSLKALQDMINDKHGEIKAIKYCDESLIDKELDMAIRLLESHAERKVFLSRTINDPIPRIATFTKEHSFESENEFRLALYSCAYFSYKFTFRENSIIPYVELPIT